MTSDARTVHEALGHGELRLEDAGVGESVADARLLLAHALRASPTWLFAHGEAIVPPDAFAAYAALLERRGSREPLQHLLGEQEFWSLRLEVSRHALIPRPETEVLVEVVLARLQAVSRPRVADVGTGTGAVALALASELPGARIVAVDVSPEALGLAARNAARLGFDQRIELVQGHLVQGLEAHGPFDAVVANLPYVSVAEWQELEPEVRDHEPKLALVGGPLGTERILELVRSAPSVLAAEGLLAVEVGAGQAPQVRAAFASDGWREVEVRRDFAGIERVVAAVAPG